MRTMARCLVLVIVCLIFIAGLSVSCAPAGPGEEEPETFYQGKTVTWILSTSVTSAYSVRAHVIGPYLGKEIGATVKMENMGTTEGINYGYTTAKPDGLNLVTKDLASIILNDIQEAPGVLYEAEKFIYIANYWSDAGGLFTSPTHPLYTQPKSPQELLQALRQSKGLKAGATSAAGYLATSAALNFEFVGMAGTGAQVITGYTGGPGGIYVAIGQGELDVISINPEDILPKVRSGEMVPLFITSDERLATYPDTPTLKELGVSIPSELQGAYDIVSICGKAVMFPPGVSQDKVDYMREVFQKLSKNEALQGEIEKANGVSGPFVSGEVVQEYVERMVANTQLAAQISGIFSKYAAAK